jgi:hypothetical protein
MESFVRVVNTTEGPMVYGQYQCPVIKRTNGTGAAGRHLMNIQDYTIIERSSAKVIPGIPAQTGSLSTAVVFSWMKGDLF